MKTSRIAGYTALILSSLILQSPLARAGAEGRNGGQSVRSRVYFGKIYAQKLFESPTCWQAGFFEKDDCQKMAEKLERSKIRWSKAPLKAKINGRTELVEAATDPALDAPIDVYVSPETAQTFTYLDAVHLFAHEAGHAINQSMKLITDEKVTAMLHQVEDGKGGSLYDQILRVQEELLEQERGEKREILITHVNPATDPNKYESLSGLKACIKEKQLLARTLGPMANIKVNVDCIQYTNTEKHTEFSASNLFKRLFFNILTLGTIELSGMIDEVSDDMTVLSRSIKYDYNVILRGLITITDPSDSQIVSKGIPYQSFSKYVNCGGVSSDWSRYDRTCGYISTKAKDLCETDADLLNGMTNLSRGRSITAVCEDKGQVAELVLYLN